MSYIKHYIMFTCKYSDNTTLLKSLVDGTPGSKGVWKNIIATNTLTAANWLIVLDDLDSALLKQGKNELLNNFNINNIIYFNRENASILNKTKKYRLSWFIKDILPQLKHVYTDKTDYMYTHVTASFIGKTYDELKQLKPPNPDTKKKLSAVVSSMQDNEYYKKRKEFIIDYSESEPEMIDIYGIGWKNELGNNYKGQLGNYYGSLGCCPELQNCKTTKFDGLYPYKFSLSLENYPHDQISSEKFTDPILSWCIPIYSGNKKAISMYPENSYFWFDINDPNAKQKIKEFINEANDKYDIHISAIASAREMILEKLNIWEHIYQIINFEKLYRNTYKFR